MERAVVTNPNEETTGVGVTASMISEVRGHCDYDWFDVIKLIREGNPSQFTFIIPSDGPTMSRERARLFLETALEMVNT